MHERDPDRIDDVLDVLETYWKENADLRLGQIVVNISQDIGLGDDTFYLEDDTVQAWLEHVIEPEPSLICSGPAECTHNEQEMVRGPDGDSFICRACGTRVDAGPDTVIGVDDD